MEELTLEYIEFTRDEIPVSKKVDIDGTLYTLEIQYNEIGDFYTSILYDEDESPLISSKLVYLGNAFHAKTEGIPERKLIPVNTLDLTSDQPKNLTVNYENFGDKIKLYLL